LRMVDAYQDGYLTDSGGGQQMAGRYLDAISWSARTVRATRLAPA